MLLAFPILQPYEFKEFDRQHRVVLFPQSFEDYQLTDGKIRLDHFLEGIEDVLPGHLHGLYQIGEAFTRADTNGMFRSLLFPKN